MTSTNLFWWLLPWLICHLDVADPVSEEEKNRSCFKCIAFDGIENPACLHPVGRRLEPSTCPDTPMKKTYLGEGDYQAKCAKVVVQSLGYKEGWLLKSWIMKRQCFFPSNNNTGRVSPYGDLNPKCGTCGRTTKPIRLFQREEAINKSTIPRQFFPDEQNQVVIFMCTCCTGICNDEEGFNLSYFERIDEANAGINLLGFVALIFLGVCILIQFGLY